MSILRRKRMAMGPGGELALAAPPRDYPAPRRRARLRRRVESGVQALRSAVERLARRPVRPLVLELPDRDLTFASPAEFEFALESRTELPVRKVAALMERPAAELRRMAANIRAVEKRFAEVLAHSLHDPSAVGDLFAEIEIKLFSQDHGWRAIAAALNRAGPEHDAYRRIALVKYMQYLGSRQDVLRNLYADRIRGEWAEAAPEPPPRAPRAAGGRPGARGPLPDTEPVSPVDTAIFHLERIELAGDPSLAALPRGETVRITIRDERAIEVRLGGHRFRLYPGEQFRLVDEHGGLHLLRRGRNMVGRHGSADVVIDPELRDVSRRHLIIEPLGRDRVAMTDLSSHGTFIPARYLGERGRAEGAIG